MNGTTSGRVSFSFGQLITSIRSISTKLDKLESCRCLHYIFRNVLLTPNDSRVIKNISERDSFWFFSATFEARDINFNIWVHFYTRRQQRKIDCIDIRDIADESVPKGWRNIFVFSRNPINFSIYVFKENITSTIHSQLRP